MYQFKSRVRFSEVDSHLNMTLPSIINYFQDCSTFHSDSIGQGIEVMMEQGYAWILSSWQIIINRYPRFGEEITISTWAHGWKAFFGYRNFKMEDAEGNILAYSNTNWIYMNIKTGRPERIPKEVSDLYACEPAIPMEEASRKIAPVTEALALARFRCTNTTLIPTIMSTMSAMCQWLWNVCRMVLSSVSFGRIS